MPEKLMRWNGSEWVEVSLVRKEVESGSNIVGIYKFNLSFKMVYYLNAYNFVILRSRY